MVLVDKSLVKWFNMGKKPLFSFFFYENHSTLGLSHGRSSCFSYLPAKSWPKKAGNKTVADKKILIMGDIVTKSGSENWCTPTIFRYLRG